MLQQHFDLATLTDRLPVATQILRAPFGGLRVIDGDYVASGGDQYRLVGFDIPEKDDLAHCDSERQLARVRPCG